MNRPLFNTAWMRFQEVNRPAAEVGRKIGGNVGLNLASGAVENAAAVRLSYVINGTGFRIHRIVNRTISSADGGWYFTRVHDLSDYLYQRLGEPDVHKDDARASDFHAQRGLLVFNAPGRSDNGGHATLWNGSLAADSSDFSATRDALFWTLR